MARIQILELPMEHHDTATMAEATVSTPFALIIDGVSEEQADRLTKDHIELIDAFRQMCGARAVGIFALTLDLP